MSNVTLNLVTCVGILSSEGVDPGGNDHDRRVMKKKNVVNLIVAKLHS